MKDSLIFFPAHVEKYYTSALKLDVDYWIIDFEDSVPNDKKNDAYLLFRKYYHKFDKSKVYVRIDLNNKHIDMQIELFKDMGIKNFLIPKIEDDKIISKIIKDISKNISLILLIESPLGLLKIEDILKKYCCNIKAIGLGGEDYKAKLGLIYEDLCLVYPRNVLFTYAKAYGIKYYDTVYFAINDDKGFTNQVKYCIDMGFDGKLLIHPKQVEIFNNYIRIDTKDMKEIVRIYESSDTGIVEYMGKYYEKPHIYLLKKMIREIKEE